MTSIIYVSDMEIQYRALPEQAYKVVKYIRDLGSQNFFYDNGVKVVPDLVIHGGDVSDATYSVWTWDDSDDPIGYLFETIYGQLYDAGIPFVSLLGNHESQDDMNNIGAYDSNAIKFVKETFQKANQTDGHFKYPSQNPDTEPSFFIAKYNGNQIALQQ